MKLLIDGDIRTDANGYSRWQRGSYVHRNLVAKALGRNLLGTEQVHHLDYNPGNNDPSNLVVCPNTKYHKLLHARQRIIDLGGHPDKDAYCAYHKKLHSKSEFSTSPNNWNGLSNNCREATNEYRKNKGLNTGKFNWRERLNQQYRRARKTGVDIGWVREELV